MAPSTNDTPAEQPTTSLTFAEVSDMQDEDSHQLNQDIAARFEYTPAPRQTLG